MLHPGFRSELVLVGVLRPGFRPELVLLGVLRPPRSDRLLCLTSEITAREATISRMSGLILGDSLIQRETIKKACSKQGCEH